MYAGASRDLDAISLTAVCISGALIFTTIQAQDFADVEGDAALGRKTFPIFAPRASRVASLLAMCAWSLFLACFWGVGPLCGGAFVAFGDGQEGMLPVRRLTGDWWELNELETMLIAAGSGDRIRLGDPVRVRVEKVDAPRGRVDLAPVPR